ncbi:MAG: tyrosine-type recombinase/integrase [Bacillota bacterium]
MRGSVKKEGSSWYYVFYLGKDANGKRRQKKKRGFKTQIEAEKALIEALNEVNKGTYIEPSKILYKDFLDQWLATKQGMLGPQTLTVYKWFLENKVIPEFGKIPLSDLSVLRIQSYINSLSNQGYSRSSVKKVYEICKNSLDYAVDYELISKNPASKVKLPRQQKKDVINAWDQSEVYTFLNTAKGDPLYIVFLIALTTGMRKSEILGLRWKDVDLDKGLLKINQTLSTDGKYFIQGAKTKTSLRTINLSPKTIDELKHHKKVISSNKKFYKADYQNLDLVACTGHGTQLNPSNVSRTFNRLCAKANVPKIRFHDLRHTHATLLLSDGTNVKVISERLGHSNTKITLDTYSHVLPTMQEEVARKLDELIKIDKV